MDLLPGVGVDGTQVLVRMMIATALKRLKVTRLNEIKGSADFADFASRFGLSTFAFAVPGGLPALNRLVNSSISLSLCLCPCGSS